MTKSSHVELTPSEKPILTPKQGIGFQFLATPTVTSTISTIVSRQIARKQLNKEGLTPLLYALRAGVHKYVVASGKTIPTLASQHAGEKSLYEEVSQASGNTFGRFPSVIFASMGGFAVTHPFTIFAGIANVNATASDQLKPFYKQFFKAYKVAPGVNLINEFSNAFAYFSIIESKEKLKEFFPSSFAYTLAFMNGVAIQTGMSTVASAVSNHIYNRTKVTTDGKLVSPHSWSTFHELWKMQGYKLAINGSGLTAFRITIIYGTVETCRIVTEALTTQSRAQIEDSITKSWGRFFKSAIKPSVKEQEIQSPLPSFSKNQKG